MDILTPIIIGLVLLPVLYLIDLFRKDFVLQEKIEGPVDLVIERHGYSFRNKVFHDAKKTNRSLADGFLPEMDDMSENEDLMMIRYMADPEIPLTDRGRKQALMTGKFIRENFGAFDIVYDSGYLRAVDTRKNNLKAYTDEELQNTKIVSNYLLRERDAGYCFNMTKKEAEKNFPYLQDHWNRWGLFLSRPPGGESQSEVCDRVALFIQKEWHKWAGKKNLIITHGGTENAFRFNLENWTMEEYVKNYKPAPVNCSVTSYKYDENTKSLKLQEYNKVYWTEEDVK